MRPTPEAAIPPLPFLQQKFKVSAIQQNNKRVYCMLYSVAICRSHDFLVSGLPRAGLGDDRGHLYRGVVAHPPLHHVLFGGQQLVQPPLPKRNSASQFSKYLDPIFIIMYPYCSHFPSPCQEPHLHLFITLFVFPFYLKTLFISQENIRCMPGYYEKKSETLNENVEIKYFK